MLIDHCWPGWSCQSDQVATLKRVCRYMAGGMGFDHPVPTNNAHTCTTQPLPTHTYILAVPAEFGAQKRAHGLFRHTYKHRQRGDSGPRRAHEHPSHTNKRLRASQRLFGTQMGPRTPLAQYTQSGTRKCIRMHANQKALGTQCGFTSASDRTCDPEH